MDINALYAAYTRRAVSQSVIWLAGFTLALLASIAIFGNTPANGSEKPEYNRIVSIGGSVTEIIYALGEQQRLIARDTTSVFPKEAFSLPDVGYIRRLSPEGVLSVEPDLILALEGSGPPEAVEALKAAKVPITFIPEGYTGDKIVEKILAVGEAIGVEAKAKELAASISLELADVASRMNASDHQKKVLFILSMRGGKVMASGINTAADGIIELAGSQNVIESFSGYKQVSDEAVISAQPDVILMMRRRGNHGTSDEEVLAHPAIATTPAGKAQRIIRMDGLYLLGFGPRTADAAVELHETLKREN